MSDEYIVPPAEPSTATKIADGIKVASATVSDAIETGKQPGMPLDILANAVREAPLAALGIAFLLGFMFARPRSHKPELPASSFHGLPDKPAFCLKLSQASLAGCNRPVERIGHLAPLDSRRTHFKQELLILRAPRLWLCQ